MNWSHRGDFTKGLLSLQLQVTTMLEGVGGDDAAILMDTLAKLSKVERQSVVPMLTRVISRLAEDHDRVLSSEEQELSNFENELYESVVSAMVTTGVDCERAIERQQQTKLRVVDGGKKV